MPKRTGKRNCVELIAYDWNGRIVIEEAISLDDYYEESHPAIDSNEFRMQRGIAKLTGTIYAPSGDVDERFENVYSSSGAYLHGKVIEADGTVVED